MILEICIYFNMDQDVDKRAGFLGGGGLYRATLLWDLLNDVHMTLCCVCVQPIRENNISYYVYQIITCTGTFSIIIHIT